MLIKPSIDELEKISEDRFLIASVVAKRARDLYETRPLTKEVCERKVAQGTKEFSMGLIKEKK